MGPDWFVSYIGQFGEPICLQSIRLTSRKLFGDKDTLMVYSMMYGPQRKAPCPMCTSFLSAWNGSPSTLAYRSEMTVFSEYRPVTTWFPGLALSAAFCMVVGTASSQMQGFPQMPGERMDGSVAIDRALKSSALTEDGKPFHALMEIGTTEPYSGQVEVWWLSPAKYGLAVTSPKFSQTKVVSGDQVQEKDEGDYYPRWLENFVLALIDPLPMAKNFRGGAVMVGAQLTQSCLRRDDRPGGITDQTTWGQVCFSGSEPRLSYILTFHDSMEFKDWKGFGKKQIARIYQTDVLDYQLVIGRLTMLEELKKPDDAMFTITAATPADQRISTSLVSTLKEESLIENAPVIQWPTVREGKADGYMIVYARIVYARTDRTGQVRETAKHNSDQPGLESFGMEQALRYKFKPLVVDGVAEQMEMPLVLHFSSHLAHCSWRCLYYSPR
jgi:hypothetical protein